MNTGHDQRDADYRSVDRARLIGHVRALLANGRADEAERLLLRALQHGDGDADLMELLAEFYLELDRTPDAVRTLARCIEIEPARPGPYFTLAEILERQGQHEEIEALYTRLIAERPDLPTAHFNRAVYLRRLNRLEAAIAAYERAIELRIDCVAEAWSNIGVILRELQRHDDARRAFEHALTADPSWLPAHYNLGLLHEEFGERDNALHRFRRVLEIDPAYHDALARIVHAHAFDDIADPLIVRMKSNLADPELSTAARESLSFALGKALDECGEFEAAFAAFRNGNALTRARIGPYDRASSERLTRAIRDAFDGAWFQRAPAVSSRPLVFICGMFRSGTTLLEQMLGAHPGMTAGGEIAYFNARMARPESGFPTRAALADTRELRTLGEGYLDYLSRRFPGVPCVINKRPDTFHYLGLLHGLFPEARFVVMQRDPLDVCLSIYFQQLDDQLTYATDPCDTAHYLIGYRVLLEHWKSHFADRMIEVDYQRLVRAPEPELRRVCAFLDQPWSERMLHFEENSTPVRTASVWQVRESLHGRAVGRWRNYANHLAAAAAMLGIAPDANGP